MPTPEFITMPLWLKITCTNTNNPPCASCQREFIINAASIKTIHKTANDHALILLHHQNYCPMPQCGGRLMFIQTTLPYTSFIATLPGEMINMGQVEMVYQDYVTKG